MSKNIFPIASAIAEPLSYGGRIVARMACVSNWFTILNINACIFDVLSLVVILVGALDLAGGIRSIESTFADRSKDRSAKNEQI